MSNNNNTYMFLARIIVCMVEQVSNKNTEKSYINKNNSLNNTKYEIHFYDIVLFLIPMFFVIGISTSIVSNYSLHISMSAAASISAIFVGYCLFFDYLKNIFKI